MKKKLFGIKLSTILTALVCLLVAVVIWIFVEFDMSIGTTAAFSDLFSTLRG